MASRTELSAGIGFLRGFQGARQERKLEPQRQAQREEAKLRRDLAAAKLEEFQRSIPSAEQQKLTQEQTTQALKLQQLENRKAFGVLAKQRAYDAFGRYEADGNTRHLNLLLEDLKQNPAGNNLMPDVIRMDSLGPASPEQNAMLSKAGIADLQTFYENPEAQKNLVKVTLANGTQEIRNMGELYVGSGYTRHMEQQKLDDLLRRSQVIKNTRQPTDSRTAEEREADLIRKAAQGDPLARQQLAALQAARKRKTAFGTVEERQAARAGFEGEEARVDVAAQLEERRVPKEEREQRIVDEAKENLRSEFGDFQQADLANLNKDQKQLVDENIRRIEQVGGLKLSEADKKAVTDIAQLISLGDPASALTSAETGIFDSLFNTARKFVSDEVGGTAATSAYAAFRNSVRNALFGSALTEAEIQSFNQAFGTLGQQKGPVLQQFATAVRQVQAKLNSIAQLNDPDVVKFRLGVSQDQLANIVSALDERIAQLGRPQPTVQTTPQPQRSLSDIFGAQ